MCTSDKNGNVVTCDIPLYATQGGGYATRTDGIYVWHSDIPDYMVSEGAKIGDEIPEKWGLVAINTAANDQRPITHEDDAYFDFQ